MLKISIFYEKDSKNDFKNEIQKTKSKRRNTKAKHKKRNQQEAFWNNGTNSTSRYNILKKFRKKEGLVTSDIRAQRVRQQSKNQQYTMTF